MRQGCILAPLLFSLYIDSIGQVLTAQSQDYPVIRDVPVPIFLYADDAVIMARTQQGLQRAVTSFVNYMNEKGLMVNIKKTYTMSCSKKSKPCNIYIDGNKIDSTNTFSYLGINFKSKGSWAPATRSRKLALQRAIGALMNFSKKLGGRPVHELLDIYKSKCISTATYGAGIWGIADVQEIQRLENSFVRYLLALPSSTATFICHMELGLTYVTDIIKINPLLLWYKV